MTELEQKEKVLMDSLQEFPSLLVLLSGGVDSAYLLYAARQALGAAVTAATAVCGLYPDRETEAAINQAQSLKVRHFFVETRQLDSEAFVQNTPERCYVCKKMMFADMFNEAAEYGIKHLVQGANADDEKDYRPGLQAAAEMGVGAPLARAGLSKTDIRDLSEKAGLSTWNKPASGCLATRFPYGTKITRKRLMKIEAAEAMLRKEGFKGLRVRYHGDLAKIEVPDTAMERLMIPDRRHRIVAHMQQIGFLYVAMDMEGFQSGRLNRSVKL